MTVVGMHAHVHYHVCHKQSHMSNAGANSLLSFTNLLLSIVPNADMKTNVGCPV